MKYIIVSVMILLMFGCESKEQEVEQNSIEQIIIDEAYVVLDNNSVMNQYRDFNQHLLDSFDIDFRTITTTTDEDIDLFANRAFNTLQQKSRSQTGKAILMVINTAQDKVRLEVSMALEPVYTDAFISYIERKGFVPYFRNDTIADAIYMAAALISDRANDAKDGKEFMPPMQSKSIGAGAKTEALIGKKNHDEKKGKNIITSSTDTPIDVLKKYLSSEKEHNTNPNLDIYTDKTKIFFSGHTVTEINQNNEVRFLTPCMDSKQVKYATDGKHAVLMNDPVNQRTCTPHFFKKEQGLWKLDIATMADVLRFNVPMQWHFDMKERLKGEAMYYAFAFDGYMLGKEGYVYEVPPERKKDPKLRWGYTCDGWYAPEDRDKIKQNPKKYMRCWVSHVSPGGPARIRLGLLQGDSIVSIGEGASYNPKASLDEFMDYLNSLSKGEIATYTVRHYKENKVMKMQGIAP